MNISELEKERMAFAFLKMIRTSKYRFLRIFITKHNRNKFWEKYKTIYGEKFVSEFICKMREDGILEADKAGRYVVSDKGKKMYKRGWIYHERHWYDADIIRKYSFVLSVLALLLSIIGTDNLRNAVKNIWQLLFQ
jgi:hypothetical protein